MNLEKTKGFGKMKRAPLSPQEPREGAEE